MNRKMVGYIPLRCTLQPTAVRLMLRYITKGLS
jgi:hypothetical protein